MRFGPLDFECFAGLQGGPGGIGDDGYARASVIAAAGTRGVAELVSEVDRGNFEDGANSGKRFDFGSVEAAGLAAVDGAALDGGDEHAGNARVDAEFGGAIDLGGSVRAAGGLADQGEFGGGLERRVGGRLESGRRRNEFSEGELALRQRVNDGALLRATLRRRDVPLRSGGAE